jgi:cathepsin X
VDFTFLVIFVPTDYTSEPGCQAEPEAATLRGAVAAPASDKTGMYMDYANPTKITSSKVNKVLSPLPATLVAADNLPASWDWRNVNGTSYVGAARNQHIPVYCGSCWAQGTTFSVSSRISIARKAAFPVVNLNPQVMVNFAQCGTCQGGDPGCALQMMEQIGLPDWTCQQYVAANGQYNAMGICETCSPTNTSFWPGQCTAVSEFTNWQLSEYGTIDAFDVHAIKAEIMSRGPVAAGVEVVPSFENYNPANGVYVNVNNNPMINHEIALAGWVTMTDSATGEQVEAWILRNSWGTAWGVDGMMYCKIGACAGAEANVQWGVPVVPKSWM